MFFRFLVFLLLFASNIFVFAQKSKETPLPIIDVHMHCYDKDPRLDARVPNPVSGRALTATDGKAHMLETVAEMKKYNIVKGMVSNYYDVALRWKAFDPNRFMTGYSFDDPSTVDLDFLRREHQAGRLEVIGEVGLQYAGIAPNDPKLEPIFALAEELDIPVGLHLGLGPPNTPYQSNPKFRTSFGKPSLLEEVLIKHPKLRIYVMHAGYPYIEETVALMYVYPQLYVDVAVIDWVLPQAEFHEYLRRLVQAGNGERIMFGSDQMVWTDTLGMAIENINAAKFLSEKQKRDIFYNNAVKFFRLDKKDKASVQK
jgi:predicted TIM-barrel fold metal-dependent hydrolase